MRGWIRWLGALIVTVALVAAAACGDHEEEEAAEDTGGQAAETVDVTAEDFSFSPPDLEAEAGQALEVRFVNDGSAAHTFTIDELGVDETLSAGEETTVTVTPSESGELRYYCRFHAAQGMEGTLTVAGEEGAGGSGAETKTPGDGDGDGYGY